MKLPAKLKMWALVCKHGELSDSLTDAPVELFGTKPQSEAANDGCTYKPVRVEVTIRPVKRGTRG